MNLTNIIDWAHFETLSLCLQFYRPHDNSFCCWKPCIKPMFLCKPRTPLWEASSPTKLGSPNLFFTYWCAQGLIAAVKVPKQRLRKMTEEEYVEIFLSMCRSLMQWLKYRTGSKCAFVATTSRVLLWRIPRVKLLSALSHPPVMQASLQFSFFFLKEGFPANFLYIYLFSKTKPQS